MVSMTENTRFCEDCLSVQPLSEFRRRSPGGSARQARCRRCHNAKERERRARKWSERADHRMGQFLNQLKNAQDSARVEWLCAAMAHEFGGTQGLVAAWIHSYRSATPGGYGAFRCI